MSTPEETATEAAFRRFHDAVNCGDPQVVAFAMLRTAFPDLHVAVEDLIAEADRVVGRNVVTGTHHGRAHADATARRGPHRVVTRQSLRADRAGGQMV